MNNFHNIDAKDHHILYSLQITRSVLGYYAHQEELKKLRNTDHKRLLRYGYKVFSQSDEDGIIEEIFKRIGINAATFIEFGVGNGIESNTSKLLIDSWKGLWIESDANSIKYIQQNILPFYNDKLVVKEAKVTAENINGLISESVDGMVDLLSIDIDYNDYWVWKAIDIIKPRVVVIEYNSSFPPPLSLTVPYDPKAEWDVSNYYGASLEALVKLGHQKGYKIVGCNYSGINAFFVREDLTKDRFIEPATSEEHYEPPRYYFPMLSGHGPRMGPFVKV